MKYSKSVTWFFLLTALLTPVVLHAADTDNQQQLTIKGVVIDEQNQPVPDAKVYVDHYQLGRDRMETRTDNQGKFALKATAARFSGQVLVVMSDSLMAQYLLPWQNIAADSSLQNLKLQVRPPKLVELEVVDQNEQPIAAAHAGIMDHDHAWGTGTTDEAGKIAFQVPHDVEIKFVGAISDYHGADYRAFTLDRDQSGDQLTKPPAFKQAREQNKRVIVQETATWCGPCRLLSLYLDRERKIWERDYIWIKLDHRWTGTHEIMKKLRNDAPGGIPWWVILDADGKILVTSNNDQDEGQNIGFPSSTSGREHYQKMLEKTAIRLNSMEINELVEALKKKDD